MQLKAGPHLAAWPLQILWCQEPPGRSSSPLLVPLCYARPGIAGGVKTDPAISNISQQGLSFSVGHCVSLSRSEARYM